MRESFIVYIKWPGKLEGYKKWPVTLFGNDDHTYHQLHTLEEVRNWLKKNNKIYFSVQVDSYQQILTSQILTVIGPIPITERETIPIQDVYTLKEAALRWGLSDGSTIRKAIERNKFENHEVKKSESTWLITTDGMMRLYGPKNEESLPSLIVNKMYYNEETGKFQTERKV
ncbi:hypothetical protein HNQ94_003149 [Salirhabdus euzebyi]|uniref:Helix-turn-helix domain-containing protein n=1 Tax=Salirhabdus euzebyi TaxID=394506 RepID=A0A841Q8C5_9BACI|nr:helix-turn-helix domain-containing protein [Salirhabdus euzebyi]MBB6454660.1 hypothetical protein [Salirhabdus euzebyi]